MKPKAIKDVETNKRYFEEIEQPKRTKKLPEDQGIDKFKPRMEGLIKKNDKPVEMIQFKKTKIKKTNNFKLKKEKKDELFIKVEDCEIIKVQDEIIRKKVRLLNAIETKIKHAFQVDIEINVTDIVKIKLKKAKEILKKKIGEANSTTNMNKSKCILIEDAELKQNIAKIKKNNSKYNSKATKPNLQKKKKIVFSKNQSKKSITRSKPSMVVTRKRSFKETGIQKLETKQNEKVPTVIKTERLKVENMNNVPKNLISETSGNGVYRECNTSLLSLKQKNFLKKKFLLYHESNKQNKSNKYTDINVKQSKNRMQVKITYVKFIHKVVVY